jgi:hypothetical protein
MPCNMIPVRRGGRKINTSLTRGIIVEFDISERSAGWSMVGGSYLMPYTTLTATDKVNCPGEMGTLCPPPPTPVILLS